MEHQEGFFQNGKNAKIYYQAWLPEGEIKAILLIVHGLGEHSGRYMNVVQHFIPCGYAVYALDHVGHGKSEGTRIYVDRFTDYTDTLKLYFDMVRGWHPETPIFLMGHSLGGLISTMYLLTHQADFSGAVLSGPAVKIADSISPTTLLLARLLSGLLPKFGIESLDANAVSSDPAVVEAYINDPLVHVGKIPARLGGEMLNAIQHVTAQMKTIRLPMLILHGSADTLADPAGSQTLYDQISSDDKTLKIYKDFYHEVYNEPGRAQVLGDVEAWLETRRVSQ